MGDFSPDLTVRRDSTVARTGALGALQPSLDCESAGAFARDDPDSIVAEIRAVDVSVGTLDRLVQVRRVLALGVGCLAVLVHEREF